MRKLVLFIATGAGTGYAPVAPGTAGAALGVALWAGLLWGLGLSTVGLLVAIALLSAVGIWAAGRAEAILGTKDDRRITVDEIAGMLVALAFLPPRIEVAAAGFLLFRLFDIWKPPPVRAAERLGGGLGVMADDLLAGVYANLGGQLLSWLVWSECLP